MTLQAVEPVRLSIPPQEWPEPEEPTRCQLCPSMLGLQWHHIVRRSATAGPKDWIGVDGLVVWNKLRVCIQCHDRINDHGYRVAWEDGTGWVLWLRVKYPIIPGEEAHLWWEHPKSGTWYVRGREIGMEVRGV